MTKYDKGTKIIHTIEGNTTNNDGKYGIVWPQKYLTNNQNIGGCGIGN